MMNIPHLGTVIKDNRFGFLQSDPIAIPALGGKMCRIIVERYEEDDRKEEYHAAIANFLSIDSSALKAAEPDIFAYYEDMKQFVDDDDLVQIKQPSDVWQHIQFGSEPCVTRRGYGDNGVYVSLECNCDWEEEHGLQIVFLNGQKVNKVGPYDGQLTNSDAYDEDSLENVVYRKIT